MTEKDMTNESHETQQVHDASGNELVVNKDKKNKLTNVHIRHFGYVRALGLTLVLLYHFYPKIIPGGFIGVDIFFVFSGYLITALALEEVRVNHRFVLKQFAERRFFRIFPTVFFAMLLVLPLTILGNDDLRYNLVNQVFAGLGFISNLYEANTGISYANHFAPHLFVHLWSLALEVQFYLVWGIIIFILSKYIKKGLSGFVFLISVCLFMISSLSMFIGSIFTTTYSGLYYSPIFHVFPFFLGAILASLAGISSTKLIRNLSQKWSLKRLKLSSIIASGLLIVLGLVLQFDSKLTYLFGFTITTVIVLSLILFLRLIHEKTASEEPRLIKYIADVSYGVYIFHWAFLIIFLNLKIPHGMAVLLTVFCSFAFATLLFYGVDPIIKGKRKIPKQLRYPSLGIMLVLAVFSVVALIKTSEQTTLAKTLWVGSNQQATQQLTLNKKAIETGTAGADTLVIGDSVTMGTTVAFGDAPKIQTAIPNAYVDAAGDRTISEAWTDSLKPDLKMLPDNATIVFALGTNSVDSEQDINHLNDMIKMYSPKHKIVLVTPANWGSGGPFNSDKVADYELTLTDKKNVKIADWRGLSKGHPGWFDVDGIHIADRPEGRSAWINLVKMALDAK